MWMLICALLTVDNNDSLPQLRPLPPLPLKSTLSQPAPPPASSLTPDFYIRHLAPTCVLERKIQHTTRLPLFFRLGDLQTVDKLEGKDGSGKRQ